MSEKILVTGATGRIGNVLVKRLAELGKDIRVFVRPTSDLTPLKGIEVEKAIGDIRDLDSVVRATEGIDIVFHLAAIIQIGFGGEKDVMDTNVGGTKNIVKASLKSGVKRFVYTSSIHAIKEPPKGQVINESCPFNPDASRGVYDRSKARATIAVLDAVKSEKLNAVVVCPTGVTGPFDYRPSLFGKSVISYLKRPQTSYLKGAYDYVDVRDVVDGILAAKERGVTGDHYLLSGEKMTMKQFYKYINEITGIKQPFKIIPYSLAIMMAGLLTAFTREPDFTPYSIKTLMSNSDVSHAKATGAFGYKPRGIKESLKDQVEWFLENGMV